MTVEIYKSAPSGIIAAPPSKSIAHRLILCAALAQGESHIDNIDLSQDILATLDCINELGANYIFENGTLTIQGCDIRHATGNRVFNCRECGTTLRFMLPVGMLLGGGAVFTGSPRLLERPMDVYEHLCKEKSIPWRKTDSQISVGCGLTGGVIQIPGNVSSQFVSGLLFALPLLEHSSRIVLTGPVESRPYIDLTLQAQRSFGVCNHWEDARTLLIPGEGKYISADVTNEGDCSNAAFLYALQGMGNMVTVTGVNHNTLQGDIVCKSIFNTLKDKSGVFDLSDCPDLAPVVFAFAAANHGGRFTGTKRLRIKESDRAAAMAQELLKFGCHLQVSENEVIVPEGNLHAPTETLYGHNDHRIVMSLAVLCTFTGGRIAGAEAVAKSWPSFFENLKRLGVRIEYET